jgi:diguanylate cyclase (GGDEF)-like protein
MMSEPRKIWSRRVLLLLVGVCAVLAGAVVAIAHFRSDIEREREAALALSRLRGDAYQQNGLEWQAIAEGELDEGVEDAVGHSDERARDLRDLGRLGYGAEATTLRRVWARYDAAVAEEFALLAAGRREGAEEVDETKVDPTFERMHELIRDADRRAQAAARVAEREAQIGTWGVAGLAVALIAWLLVAAHGARQRSALAALQQLALRERLAEREHDAHHDALTGLANRRRFGQRLEEALETVSARGGRVAVLLVDLDRFKDINDALGHHVGDALLIELAQRLTGALREADVLARLGGDEFAILLPGVRDATAAEEIARRMLEVIEGSFDFDGIALQVSASIGIALAPDHGDGATVLLQRADVAMYQAKNAHVGCALYAPGNDEHSRDRLALAGELRHALDNDELVVFYQPKADLRTGRVDSVEALVRWQHPERGLLGPYQFLPIAEQSGLIRDLTLHVLDRALAQLAQWETEGLTLSVAVNLAVANLVDIDLPHDVARLLARWQVAPERLQLEITENLLMADRQRAERVLRHLREIGCGMSLDDFGTGYSSLAHLRRLAVQEIKIDRSFVQNMTEQADDAAIVASTILLAHSLNLRVVAEGVETREHWERLEALGCDEAQGYVLTRPIPAEELTAWLRRHPTGPANSTGATLAAPASD